MMVDDKEEVLTWDQHVTYCSIESRNDVWTQHYKNQNLLQACDWVATEKVHGANFSFITNGKEVRGARRKAILKADDNFFNFQIQLQKYSKNVLSLYNYMKKKDLIKGEMIIIYGEMFGGKYPHPSIPQEKKSKPIQYGIYYTPTIEFLAFDLFDGKDFMDFDLMIEMFKENEIPYIKELTRGNFDQVSNYNPEFQSTIPTEYFGLPKLTNHDNLAEGIIIKPIKNLRTEHGSRVILKIKIENFGERSKNPDKKNKTKSKPINEIFKEFININRLASVISKEGELNEENQMKYAELLFEDALKDFKKDDEMITIYSKLSDDDKQIFKNKGMIVAKFIIQEYFNILRS